MRLTRARCMMLSLILMLLAACGPAPAATAVGTPVDAPPAAESATPAPAEPAKVVSSDSLTICVLLADDEHAALYEDHITRLQKLIYGAGWKVQLSVLKFKVPDKPGGEDPRIKAIRAQFSAGRQPDAWYVPADSAQKMRDAGMTRDMGDILPAATPMLWQACKDAFAGAVNGVPMTLSTDGVGPISLLMSTEALASYGRPIANADDILTYLEQTTDTTIGGDFWGNMLLIRAWAAEQGYDPVAGLPDLFYARRDDPDCTIVPVEDIPGFGDFYTRSINLGIQKRLWGLFGDSSMTKLTGMMVFLKKGPDHQVQVWMDAMGKDITALPLAGCYPDPAPKAPVIQSMLAVNANSSEADAVAGFAQWALMDPSGYDLCTLGQQGTDYRMVDGCVEYLNAGKPLAPADWYPSLNSPVFALIENSFVSNSNLLRATIYEAANADTVWAQTVTQPSWKVKLLRPDNSKLLSQLSDGMNPNEDPLQQRYSDLLYMVTRNNDVPEFTPEQVLKRLQDNRPKLNPLLAVAQSKLNELLSAGD